MFICFFKSNKLGSWCIMITLAIPNNCICYSYRTFSVLLESAFLFFLQVVISPILSLLSVFSQLPTSPFLGQNLLPSNQSSTCFFFLWCVLFWLPVAFPDLVNDRESEESPWYSQKYHCLCLLDRGKKRETASLMPLIAALPLLAPPPPPTATYAQPQEP